MLAKSFIPFILAVFASVACAAPLETRAGTFQHMFIIILENTDYSDAINDPNLSAFASGGRLYTNWQAITHPSEPNYIAMTSGDTQGVTDDSDVNLNVRNVVDLLEAGGKTWRAYMENYPGNCFTGTSASGGYVRLAIPYDTLGYH